MIKITGFLLLIFLLLSTAGFAQIGSDGSYYWNSTSLTYSLNKKTELYFGNKDHYSNQINRLEYFHFELIGYRKLSNDFSLGIGIRQTENYKLSNWVPGQTYMLYGVLFFNPWDLKIKFANRLTAKVSKTADTQYGLDNITNIDFFVRSANKIPKPYFMDEIFSGLTVGKVQTIRLYGGFRVVKSKHFGLDLYYCYWKTRPAVDWK